MGHKIALVTGASSGIGESTARRLHDAGFAVHGAARRVDRTAAPACAPSPSTSRRVLGREGRRRHPRGAGPDRRPGERRRIRLVRRSQARPDV
ncbi:SDR family NAD(P)-dependent oxidoreductase [Nonomuraea sp. NPDC050153]|uniref:SDR family NAD(P)-dependent oxidoreductase n=1 Tax=Nonomuraea sp. NPDC050153 TaxID=3364359 RepID=UPI0037B15C8C